MDSATGLSRSMNTPGLSALSFLTRSVKTLNPIGSYDMYAIKNVKTNKWVYGTDYRYHPPKQRTSMGCALIFESLEEAEIIFKNRKCGKDYKIVQIEIKEV